MYSFFNMTIDEAGHRYFQYSEGSFYLDLCLGIILFCAMFLSSIKASAKMERLENKIKSDKIYIQWLHEHAHEHITIITIPETQPKGPSGD